MSINYFRSHFDKYKKISPEKIMVEFIETFNIFMTDHFQDQESKRLQRPIIKYLTEKYVHFVKPYKRGKHFKNVIRKIKRDENLRFEKKDGYLIVHFKKGVAPSGRWHREEGYPVKNVTPDEAKAETF